MPVGLHQVETGSAITWKYPSCVLKGDNSVGEFYSVALTNNAQQADTGAPSFVLQFSSSCLWRWFLLATPAPGGHCSILQVWRCHHSGWRLVQSDPHPFETRHRNTMPHSVRLFSVRVSMFHLMRRLQDGTHRQEHALAHCVEGHLRWPQPQRLPRPRVGAHTDLWSRALVFSSLALSCLPLSCLRLLLSFAVSATLPGQCTACCLHLQCGCRSRAAGVSGTFLSCRSRRRPLAPATTRSATAC